MDMKEAGTDDFEMEFLKGTERKRGR